jgi:amino acid adenylation domain-containing protein
MCEEAVNEPAGTSGESGCADENEGAVVRRGHVAGRVDRLFSEQAERTPDAVAVAMGDEAMTYRELDDRADVLAGRLRALGAGLDVLVGLCVERSFDMAVGVLGILKAGCAYVPLDSAYPAERLALMVRDAAVAVIVAQTKLSAVVNDSAALLLLDALPDECEGPMVPVEGDGRDLAYVLYTSGSTGRPKGVAMPHGSLVNLIEWHRSLDSEARRTLQFAPLSFDVSFQEMFSTWSTGGTLELISEEQRLQPDLLWELIVERGVERVFVPVVMLQQLAEAAGRSGRDAPRLREVITAEESLRITPAVRRFFASRGGCRLHNHYGPTETHVVTWWALPDEPTIWPDLPPIGRPIHNAAVYVLDAGMQPVPAGQTGELWIGGAVLARGYWRDAEKTTERFVKDPFSLDGDAMLYRTGDLGKIDGDGVLHFVGRADGQVKIRGFWVELGEIEAALGRHPCVSGCAVAARLNGAGDKLLTAFLTTGRDQA